MLRRALLASVAAAAIAPLAVVSARPAPVPVLTVVLDAWFDSTEGIVRVWANGELAAEIPIADYLIEFES